MERVRLLFRKYRIESWLVVLGLAVVAMFALQQRIMLRAEGGRDLTSVLGVPLDDVYIHCRYAANLLHGSSFSFDPSQTLTADTSPLWVVLIALGGLLTTRLELVAIGLSIVSYLILVPGVYRASRDVFGLGESHARVAGVATAVASRLAWSAMSGMETALAALLMLLAVEEHVRSRSRALLRVREVIWLGLGVLVRPELLFVMAVCAVDWAIVALQRKGETGAWPVVVGTFCAITAPALLLPTITEGQLAFHSSLVQGAHVSILPDLGYLWFAARIIVSNNLLLSIATILGVVVLIREERTRIIAIIAIGLPLLQAFVAPVFRHHGRYFFLVLPLFVILGMMVWQGIETRSPVFSRYRMVLLMIMLAVSIAETARWSYIAAASVRNINDQHLEAVEWLREHRRPGDVLAVDDVGAIGYKLDAHVLDLTGLTTPALWATQPDQSAVWREARRRGANLFVIYLRLAPELYRRHSDSLELQRDLRVRLPLTSAADTVMSIYRVRETSVRKLDAMEGDRHD